MRFEVRKDCKGRPFDTVWDSVNNYHVASAISDDAEMIVKALNNEEKSKAIIIALLADVECFCQNDGAAYRGPCSRCEAKNFIENAMSLVKIVKD